MIEITIRNTDTDETIVKSGEYVLMHVKQDDGVGTVMIGSASAVDIIETLVAHDMARDSVFKEHPAVELGYKMKDLILNVGAMVDVAELKRQLAEEADADE